MSTVERGGFRQSSLGCIQAPGAEKGKTLGPKVEALLAWCRFVQGELGKLRGKAARAHPAAASSTSSSATASPHTSNPSQIFMQKALPLSTKPHNSHQEHPTADTPTDETSRSEEPGGRGKKGGKGINPANIKVWRPGFPRGRYFHV